MSEERFDYEVDDATRFVDNLKDRVHDLYDKNEELKEAKERLKEIVDFYKLNDENNYDYSDDVLISMKLVLEEIERLNNKLKDIKSQLDYLETYSSEKDVFEDMKRRLDRIESIVNRK